MIVGEPTGIPAADTERVGSGGSGQSQRDRKRPTTNSALPRIGIWTRRVIEIVDIAILTPGGYLFFARAGGLLQKY